MQIGDILNTYNNNLSTATSADHSANSANATGVNNAADVPNGAKGVEQLYNTAETLKTGNVFEGTINSVDGNKVTIGLSNGQTISARLDTGVSLSDGQSVFFQVKGNEGGTVQIKPLSTELSGNPTLLNALNSASVAVSERSLNMVNQMMKEQMPIDTASLNNMNRLLMSNPDINPTTLVTMTKLGLPMNIEMASQFENYQTNQAQISSDLQAVVDAIPASLTDASLSGAQTIELNNNLLSAFGLEAKAAPMPEGVQENAVENAEGGIEGNSASNTAGSNTADINTVGADVANAASSNEVNTDATNAASSNEVNTDATNAASSNGVNTDATNVASSDGVNTDGATTSSATASTNNATLNSDSLNSILTDKNYTNLNNAIKELPDIRQAEPGLFDDKGNVRKDISAKNFLSAVMDYTNNNPEISKEKLNHLFGTNAYKKMINNVAEKSFTLRPEDITKEGEVQKFYEKILKQADDILAASERAGKATAELSKAAGEVKSNVNFMNQVNELYNFVQLPVKLSNQTANSDLYVFQNKKKNYQEGDELTAFLHFDLEHLGSTDINVKMQRRNVSCDWVLENEDSLKLIEANLDKLEARLNAKGYNCKFSAKSGENDFNFVDDFLKQDTKPAGIVHRYSFDMKA